MINIKDPVRSAYTSMAISFIVFIVIVYIFKPRCVQIIDRYTGITHISWKLAISYSATFSFIIAIGMLILLSNNLEEKNPGYELKKE
jgi:hypothetical protein